MKTMPNKANKKQNKVFQDGGLLTGITSPCLHESEIKLQVCTRRDGQVSTHKKKDASIRTDSS
jgi:hypothetical protein